MIMKNTVKLLQEEFKISEDEAITLYKTGMEFGKPEEIVTHALYSCLTCDHSEKVVGTRRDYKEVISCPKCSGEFIDSWKIDKYKRTQKDKAEKDMKNNTTGTISIGLDMDSTKMQRQLRAIAKHTEALADALKQIDEEVCPECGSNEVEVTRAYGNDGKVWETAYACDHCGYGKE